MNYQEIQRFSSLPWIWPLVLPMAGLMWYAAYQQVLLGQPVGSSPAPNALLILCWLAFGLLMPLAFGLGGMRTEVRAEGLYIESYPLRFCSRQFNYADIETFVAKRYRPLRDFGGWGIRRGLQGRAYTVSGNQGVQLVFKTGQQVLIGSQQPEKLVKALTQKIPLVP